MRWSSRARGWVGGPLITVSLALGLAHWANATTRPSPAPPSTGVPSGMSFHSAPGLHPPTVTVRGQLVPESGDIFLTPRNSYQRRVDIQHGPMILDSRGHLVWFRRAPPGNVAINLQVQSYRGRPVLTWWQGTDTFSAGFDVIVDSSYRRVAVLRAEPPSAGYATDAHDFQITSQGTALIEGYAGVHADLRRVGGPADGVVQDDIVQELDIKTGRVLWEWHSYGHVPLRASYVRPAGSNWFDYFHLNSLQQLPNGNILVSARNTWGIYEISRRTGRVIWTLGGKDSSFRLGPGARFSWQHDAHMSGHTLSVFDDGSDGPSQQERQSSAKVLKLDTHTMTATLAHRYTHRPVLLTVSQGSVQRLPGGKVLVGWGADPRFSEYARGGGQIFDASFVLGVNTYRAYSFPWIGRPTTRPALAVFHRSRGGATLYASWNGATQVAAWRVLDGTAPGSLKPVVRAARTGFETTIRVSRARAYFAVQALGAGDQLLGTSRVVPASRG
jgi:Arylsulfotransferase (ASST)